MKNALRCFLFMRRLQIASSMNLEQCVCPERLFRLNQPLQLQKARAPHRCSLIPLHIFLKNKSLWRNAQKKKEKTLTQPRRFVTFIRCKVKKPQRARLCRFLLPSISFKCVTGCHCTARRSITAGVEGREAGKRDADCLTGRKSVRLRLI